MTMYTRGKLMTRSLVDLGVILLEKLLSAERYEEAALVKAELQRRTVIADKPWDIGPWYVVKGIDKPVSLQWVLRENLVPLNDYRSYETWQLAYASMRIPIPADGPVAVSTGVTLPPKEGFSRPS